MSALADHFRAGEGEPLLLVHGFTATWRAWGPVPHRLADELDVLAVTLPGHTRGPALPPGPSIPALLDGLEAMLDEVGWATAHLAGFSLGGWLSLELAKRGRARSVTAFAPGGATTERDARERRRIRALFARLHRAAALAAPRADALCRRPRYRRVALRDQMVDGARLRPQEAADLMHDFVATPVFRRFLGEIGSGEGLADLDRIDVPVTVVWGERDRVLPPRLHLPFFLEGLPRARFETLPRAGHVPFWEAEDAVLSAIVRQVSEAAAQLEPAAR